MRVRLMAAAAVLVVVAGCGLGGRGDDKAEGSAPVAVTAPSSPSEEPTPEDSPTPEETTSSPTPKPKPSKTKVSKTPTTPPEGVNNFEVSPCHTTEGTEVSKTKVKAALKTAAGKIYWTHEAPTLKLNYPLVKAIAWHESGWQSNVFNCDGGQGLMQLMPETVDMINNRFGLSYNVSKYQENATAGANYLAWLTRYMSQKQFGEKTYDLSASKCKTHSSWCLLNLVISAYQAGPDAVLQNAKTKKLPNPAYVDSVRSLMSSCFCDRY
ncbi:transglycosylase SLT domain-containing protein [Actinoplanes regularis]|uniref:transglycosylase SLT domain-containing protein n=1 Tax=Actinoplanes regularis TaxID=52697 RepID=UPI002556E404|nr:transglycosylase SLT domain-containing protein [Actinoplanes regularis]